MPANYRRRVPPPPQLSPPGAEFSDSEEDFADQDVGEAEGELEDLEEDLEQDEDDEEVEEDAVASPIPSPSSLANTAPPPNFREISTLASWTVSSSKPGCSVPQLRHPSTQLFWQSDGPQPHYLNIHFFKLVRVVGLRLFLDFEADESYTPTRIVLLAGSGMNDLVEWGEMRLENPRGWIWADFEGVRDPDTDSESDAGSGFNSDDSDAMDHDYANEQRGGPAARQGRNAAPPFLPIPEGTPRGGDDPTSDFENAAPSFTTPLPPSTQTQPNPASFTTPTPGPNPLATDTPTLPTSLARPSPRLPFTPLNPSTTTPASAHRRARKPPKPPLLRCHLIQIKILENHQNGKDTHLRGLQVFALDNDRDPLAAAAKEAAAYRREGQSTTAGARQGRAERARPPQRTILELEDEGDDAFAGLAGGRARSGRGSRGRRVSGGGGGGGESEWMLGEEPVLR